MAALPLTDMLSVLRQILEEHPDGITLDAEMVAAMVGGLRDMELAAEALQQAAIELAEIRADEIALVEARANVIPWPIVPRPIPLQGGAA